MNKEKLSPAGFWIRLLTRITDSLIPIAISIGVLFALIEKKLRTISVWEYDSTLKKDVKKDVLKNLFAFKEDYMFYIWVLLTIALLFISFIVIPYFTKGKTIAMMITKTKITFEDKNIFMSLVKREGFFSLGWITLLILVMTVINHTLVNNFAINVKDVVFSDTDKLRIGVVSAAGTLIIVFQLISVVGIVAKRDKRGFHDRASKTTTVWTNKFLVETEQTSFVKNIQPRLVKDEIVEWIKE